MAAGDRGPTLSSYGASVDEAERTVVLLHGRDQDPGFMEEHVVRRLDLEGVAYLAPVAPERTWYPFGFAMPRVANEPALTRSLQIVATVVDQLWTSGFPRSRTFLVGFSQGACLAAEFVAHHDHDVGGLVVLTGALIGAPEEVEPIRAPLAGLPVYLATSDDDSWVPVGRAEQAAAFFRQAGADVRFEVFPGMGHEICDAEIDATRALLTSRIPDAP